MRQNFPVYWPLHRGRSPRPWVLRLLGGEGDDRVKSNFILLAAICSLLVTSIGCDAFVRKFTRKQNKEQLPQEELVLAPEEYKTQMSKEELYRQYLLFWKSWQGELINALSREGNHKKQVKSMEEALNNLVFMKSLLNDEAQKKLDVYLKEMAALKAAIEKDEYNNNFAIFSSRAERIKMGILRDFSYNKIKDYLR